MRGLILLAIMLGASFAILESRTEPRQVRIATGKFEANDEAMAQGYFVLGEATLVAVKPGSVSHDLMKDITYEGRTVTLYVRVEE